LWPWWNRRFTFLCLRSVLTTEAHFVPVEVRATAGSEIWSDTVAGTGQGRILLAEDALEKQRQQEQHPEETQNTSTVAPPQRYRRSCPIPVFTQRCPPPPTLPPPFQTTFDCSRRYRAFGFVSAHEILQRISSEEVPARVCLSYLCVSILSCLPFIFSSLFPPFTRSLNSGATFRAGRRQRFP
jgi:hypothetical protein